MWLPLLENILQKFAKAVDTYNKLIIYICVWIYESYLPTA